MDIDSALRVGRHLVIPPAELEWRFSASGGPGGQHANTANTRVELIFDVAGSAVLGPRQRARLLERLAPVPGWWWSTSAPRSATVRSRWSAWPHASPRPCASNGLAGRPSPPRRRVSAGCEPSSYGPPARWSGGGRRPTPEGPVATWSHGLLTAASRPAAGRILVAGSYPLATRQRSEGSDRLGRFGHGAGGGVTEARAQGPSTKRRSGG